MIRVFEYGCLRPLSGENDAFEQIRRRNRFWNALVEIENKYREDSAKLLSDTEEQKQIESMTRQLKDLRDQIKLRRQRTRSKKVAASDLQTEIDATKKKLNSLIAVAKEERKHRIEARKSQLVDLNAARVERVKEVTHESGLYWCNYNDVLTNYDTARRLSNKGLSFHRFAGEGKVSIRYQTGLDSERVFGKDTRFQIRNLTPEEIQATNLKNPRARHVASIRVGSTRRAPIWFTLPTVLHRPLPEGSTVRSAAVKREMVAGKVRYKLLVTIDDRRDVAPKTGDKVCAIDVGWRNITSENPSSFARRPHARSRVALDRKTDSPVPVGSKPAGSGRAA